jgi:hypothetical protein
MDNGTCSAIVATVAEQQEVTGDFFYVHVTAHRNRFLFNNQPDALIIQIYSVTKLYCGPGSVVGIATAYGLDGPGIESWWGRDFPYLSRQARWGARFSVPVQTGPDAHPASCTMGTGSFPGVSCGRGVRLTPHPLLVPRSKTE